MTTETMGNAEQVAANLSEAQREAIAGAVRDGSLGNYFIRGQASKELHKLGLTTIVWSGLMLNETGRAVRAILRRQA